MSIILKGYASWYSATDKGGNANVSMMSARKCPECGGYGQLKVHIENKHDDFEFVDCKRCNGDGKLINQMPFNTMGMECAMPLSLIEKYGLRFGQLVKVSRESLRFTGWTKKSIIVRLVDIGPNEKLCAEGRIIDLTEGAFKMLEDTSKGLIPVEIEVK